MRTIILTVALMAGLAAQGYANTSYSLAGGVKDSGGNPVSASAILSLSMVGSQEVLTITLDNFTPSQTSDGENITGVELNINSSQITGASIASSSADLIDIHSKTAVTDLGVSSLSHWKVATSLSELTVTTIGGGQPTQAIIGAPGSGNDYSNANGSLTGSTKQPYSNQTATFQIDLSGRNISMSSIAGVEIGFGTQGNNYIGTTLQTTQQQLISPTPEPGTFWLLCASAVLIGLGSQRKRLASSQAKTPAPPFS